MASKDQVIANFAKQTGKYTHGSRGRSNQYNIWYSGRVLYSFGTHFPLAVRHQDARVDDAEGFGCGVQYIINGDKYSSSTSSHQRECIGSLKENVQIPFSALEEAWNWGLERTLYYKEWGEWFTCKEAQEEESKLGTGLGITLYQAGWGSIANPEWVSRANALAEKLKDGSGGFKIVAYRKDTWQHSHDEGKSWLADYFSGWTGGADKVTCPNCGWEGAEPEIAPKSAHRLGAVLFRIRENTFLSSFDEQDRSNYFLCQVPGSPTTIEEAYEALVPEAVKALPSREQVLRQGDWFFIPVSEDKDVLRVIKSWSKSQEKFYRLGGTSGTHMVTKARIVPMTTIADEATGQAKEPLVFVQGMVRHSPTDGRRPEHRRLKLGDGKTWYVPVKNTSEAGWGAVGNVD